MTSPSEPSVPATNSTEAEKAEQERRRIRIGSQRSTTPVSSMKPVPPPLDLRTPRPPGQTAAPAAPAQPAPAAREEAKPREKTFAEMAAEQSPEIAEAVAKLLAKQAQANQPREAAPSSAAPSSPAAARTSPRPPETARAEPPKKPAEAASAAPPEVEAKPAEAKPKPPKPPMPVPVEVPRRMSEELEAEVEAALGNFSLDQILAGEAKVTEQAGAVLEPETRVQGTVMKVDREFVFFALPSRNEGLAGLKQFAKPPQPGETMDVVVQKFNAEEGLYEITVPGASVSVADWGDIDEGMVVEARVTGHNTGGLECEVNHIRGFIPVSQVALYRVENLEEYVGQKFACVVTEANPQRRNLVLSRRAMLEREQEANRNTFFEKLEVGQAFTGTVRKLMDFGAFVELAPGVDGLIHISQMSWDRIKHPSEVLKEGQKVEVRIEKVDPNTRKIGLSYRELQDNPWNNVERKYPPGVTVKGVVSRLAQFGAFVKLEPGVEGLIHISELAHYRVARVQNVVQEGQEVEVKVLEVDREKQRISLSLKATMAPPEPKKTDKPAEAVEDDTPEPPRELAVTKRRKGPLKGGTNKKTGGEGLGLQW
jgi:small subunit ribosomal protein S1